MSDSATKNQAEAFRQALICGYSNPKDVALWADDLIAREDSVDPAVIDVSLHMKDKNRMAEDLLEVKGSINRHAVRAHCLLLLGKFFLEQPDQWRLVRECLQNIVADYDLEEHM